MLTAASPRKRLRKRSLSQLYRRRKANGETEFVSNCILPIYILFLMNKKHSGKKINWVQWFLLHFARILPWAQTSITCLSSKRPCRWTHRQWKTSCRCIYCHRNIHSYCKPYICHWSYNKYYCTHKHYSRGFSLMSMQCISHWCMPDCFGKYRCSWWGRGLLEVGRLLSLCMFCWQKGSQKDN